MAIRAGIDSGDDEAAERIAAVAANRLPQAAGIQHIHSRISLRRKKLPAALRQAVRALSLAPGQAALHRHLGDLLVEDNRPLTGVRALRCALALSPSDQALRRAFGECLNRIGEADADASLEADLVRVLDGTWVRPGQVTSLGYAVLRRRSAFSSFIHAAVGPDAETRLSSMLQGTAPEWAAEGGLAARLLASAILTTPEVETALAALRRAALGLALQGAGPDRSWLGFLVAMAQQCHLNEFAWWRDDEEATGVEALAGRLAHSTAAVRALLLAIIGSYRSVTAEEVAPLEDDATDGPKLDALVRQQVLAPAEERRIAADLPTLTAIEAGVSEAVRQQYEEKPLSSLESDGADHCPPIGRRGDANPISGHSTRSADSR